MHSWLREHVHHLSELRRRWGSSQPGTWLSPPSWARLHSAPFYLGQQELAVSLCACYSVGKGKSVHQLMIQHIGSAGSLLVEECFNTAIAVPEAVN